MNIPTFIQIFVPGLNVHHHKITAISCGDGYWNCVSHKPTPGGYARIRYNGIDTVIRRVVYEYYNGPIPEGMIVHHLCDNPGCINPDHLELMALKKDAYDSYDNLEENSNLRQGEVLVLNDHKGLHRTSTYETNVSVTTIKDFQIGRTWKHLFRRIKSTMIIIKRSLSHDEDKLNIAAD